MSIQIQTESEMKLSHSNSDDFDKLWDEAGSFQKMIFLMWLSVIVESSSCFFAAFDVRYYYQMGFLPELSFYVGGLLLSVWLIIAIMQLQNWARKSFIVLTLISILATVLCFLLNGVTDWIIDGLDVVSVLIDTSCLCMCFSKETVAVFKERKGRGKCWGWLFWFVVSVFLSAGVVMQFRAEGSSRWVRDCKLALLAGSKDAKESYIGYLKNQILEKEGIKPYSKLAYEKDAEIEHKAQGQLEAFLKENAPVKAGLRIKWRAGYGFMMWKCGGKLFAGLLVLIASCLAALTMRRSKS